MKQEFNKKQYGAITKVVNVILKWSITFVFVILGIMLVGFIAVVFIPQTLLNFNMANLEHINIQFANIMYQINENIFSGITNVKNMILIILFAGIVNLSFFQFVQIQLRKIVSSINDELPFKSSNAVILRNLGLGYIIASIVVSLINSWMMVVIVNTFEVYQASINFSINLQMAFMGIIILILAYAFSYGSFLQEEHDTTL
ncbi:MAG: DUF2975 domain-containing protein [Candidatus Izemoplasmatales bacterium]|nr:DUF2975 domain-containing protein [Candidatus Izemoplasmatales bacterium]